MSFSTTHFSTGYKGGKRRPKKKKPVITTVTSSGRVRGGTRSSRANARASQARVARITSPSPRSTLTRILAKPPVPAGSSLYDSWLKQAQVGVAPPTALRSKLGASNYAYLRKLALRRSGAENLGQPQDLENAITLATGVGGLARFAAKEAARIGAKEAGEAVAKAGAGEAERLAGKAGAKTATKTAAKEARATTRVARKAEDEARAAARAAKKTRGKVRELEQRAAARSAARRAAKAGTKAGKRAARRRAVGASVAGPLAPVAASITSDAADKGYYHLAEVPYQTGKAFLESGKVRAETLRGLKALPREFVQGIYKGVTDPVGTFNQMKDQYAHQYGPLLSGDTAKFRRQLEKAGSGGVVGPVLDTALIAGPAASAAGFRVAKTGALGKTLKDIAESDRPNLRYGAGRDAVKRQEASNRILKRLLQARRDASRRKLHERRHAEAQAHGGGRPTDALDPQELRRQGEVVPRDRIGPQRVRTSSRLSRKQATRDKARERLAQHNEQHDVVDKRAGKELIGSLNKQQRRALHYVLTGRVTPDDPLAAVRDLQAEERRIRVTRGRRRARGQAVQLHGRRLTNDEIPTLRKLIRDAQARGGDIYNEEFRRVAEELSKLERQAAKGREPLADLSSAQAEIRRLKPMVESLIEQGHLPEVARLIDASPKIVREELERQLRKEHINLRKLRRKIERTRLRAAESRGRLQQREVKARAEVRAAARKDKRRPLKTEELPTRAERVKYRQDRNPKNRTAAGGPDRGKPVSRLNTERDRLVSLEGNERALRAEHERTLDRIKRIQAQLDRPMSDAEKARLRQAEDALQIRRLAEEEAQLVQRRRAGGRLSPEERARLAEIRMELSRRREQLNASDALGTAINQLGHKNIEQIGRGKGRIRPAYVPSERRLVEKFGLRAVGGSRATAPERRFSGELFRTGREATNPQVFLQGLEKSIKRKHNISLLARSAETHGLPLPRLLVEKTVRDALARLPEADRAAYKGMDPVAALQDLRRAGKVRDDALPPALKRVLDKSFRDAREALDRPQVAESLTVKEVQDALSTLGIDESHVTLFNPGKMYRHLKEAEGADIAPDGELADVPQVGEAFSQAKIAADRINHGLREETGYIAIPKEAMEELETIPGQFEKAARAFDISKSQFSRLLLGYFNTSWVAFQIGANVILTGLARTGPFEYLRAQAWWHRLPEAQKEALRPILNIQSNLMDVSKRSFGATGGDWVNRWRAIKETDFYRKLHTVSPSRAADFFFSVDRAQTASFRRAVFYHEVKKEALANMWRGMGDAARIQDQLTGRLFGKGLDETINTILENRLALEQHAETVDRMLGDYAAFTARERATLNRFVMFYGFLRHSVQYALWTLPTRHPIIAGIIGKLALLSDKERRELLGIDDLPLSLAGLEIDGTPDGKGLVLNLGRMSPTGNALFEAEGPNQLLGVLPPAVSIPLEQALGTSLFTGTPFAVGGSSVTSRYLQMAGLEPGPKNLTLIQHVRVLANQLESYVPPLRLGREILYRGRQGNDASLTFGIIGQGAAPIDLPKSEPYRSQVIASEKHDRSIPAGTMILRQLLGIKEVTPSQVRYIRERQKLQKGGSASSSSSSGSSFSDAYDNLLQGGSGSSSFSDAYKKILEATR